MAQILPSMLFGYIYDCLHKWTDLEISTILMSILGLGLVCLLNLFTIELMMIAAFISFSIAIFWVRIELTKINRGKT